MKAALQGGPLDQLEVDVPAFAPGAERVILCSDPEQTAAALSADDPAAYAEELLRVGRYVQVRGAWTWQGWS